MEITSYQAWLTGFTTGVLACLNGNNEKLTTEEFKQQLTEHKLDDLTIIHNVGADEPNGMWAIAGARMGTYLVMVANWDYTQFTDQAAIDELWNSVEAKGADMLAGSVAEELVAELNLPMVSLDAQASAFFKYHLDTKYSVNVD